MENMNYGLDDVTTEDSLEGAATASDEKVIPIEQIKKKLPYHVWEVRGVEYKLVIKADVTCMLEDRLKKGMLDLITDGGIPKLGVMLTIIQGAMKRYQHGISFGKVQGIYDQYQEDGGSMTSLFTDVILPLYRVSGFLSEKQSERSEEIAEELR